MDIQEIEAHVAVHRLIGKKGGAIELFDIIINDFKEREYDISKRESNLQTILKNIKPEHLEEVKKLITPEIFNSLNL